MIMNIAIGDTIGNVSNSIWTIEKDEKNPRKSFLQNKTLRQRILIDKRIADTMSVSLIDEEGDRVNGTRTYLLSTEDGNSDVSNYYGIYVTNNNITMNPMIKPVTVAEKPSYDVVYLTLCDEYKMYGYQVDHKIFTTYHNDTNHLYGCGIAIDSEMRKKCFKIASLKVRSRYEEKFYFINVEWNALKELVEIEMVEITSKEKIAAMKAIDNRFKHVKSDLGFRVNPNPGELLTNTYVVNVSNRDLVRKLTRPIKNKNIIFISDEIVERPEQFLRLLKKIFRRDRVSTVTTVGFNLTTKMINELKLTYVFNYDTANNKLICKRSN